MRSFITVLGRGWPMTWRTLSGGIQTILAIITLIGVLIAPIGIIKIELLWLSVIAWISWGVVVAFFAIVIGLWPYRGQKAITEDCEKVKDNYYRWFLEEKRRRENIEQENIQLKEENNRLKQLGNK